MKKILRSIILLIVFIAVAAVLWWVNGTSAADAKNTKQQMFVIAKGEGARQIAFDLKSAGLIRDPWVFFLLVKTSGSDGKIQAGDFRLSPNQTPQNILQTLIKGTLDIWVTIPEGKRATEIAALLKERIPTYQASWEDQLATQEGYLFPDTYLFAHDATIDQIMAIMEDNFKIKYAKAKESQTNSLSQKDAVIVASIIEREGKSDTEMRNIASVLENRLNLGMALQIDATIQYAKGTHFDWWPKIGASDVKLESAYNTYRNPGLPPTPISNPGLVALSAALNPSDTSYLYYFTDRNGITHFARTLEEQNANIKKFGL